MEVVDPAIDRLIPKKVFVRNAIDPEWLEPRPPSGLFRSRFGLQDKSVVLFLGRIHPVKGLDLLITAFGKVIRKKPDTVLVIAGPDSEGYGKVIDRQIKSGGISQKVIMAGMLTGVDKLAALADADLLVQPSYQEGHSIAVTEALYYGVPVVISEACHMPEVASHNAGVIVDNKAMQLSNVLIDLLSNPERRITMGEAGRLLALRYYSWDAVAREMKKVYEEILMQKHVKEFGKLQQILI
jgi:glycosyltransferase involved in cell wall biosynthesis